MEVLGKLNIRHRQGEGSYPFKALRISSLFTTVKVSSVAIGNGESYSARIVGPMRGEGKKSGNPEVWIPGPSPIPLRNYVMALLFSVSHHGYQSKGRNVNLNLRSAKDL